MLEAAGLTAKEFGDPSPYRVPKNLPPPEQIVAAREHVREFYQSRKELKLEFIRQRLCDQEQYYSKDPPIEWILNETLRRASSDKHFDYRVIAELAARFTQRASIYDDFNQVQGMIMLSGLAERSQGIDVPLYQAMHDSFNLFRREAMNDARFNDQQRKYFRDLSLPEYKSHRDMVDGDLIHFSVMGLMDETVRRVVAITFDDNPVKTYARVRWAKNMYCYSLSWLKIKSPSLHINPCFGDIYCLDRKTLALKRRIKIKTIDLFVGGDPREPS